MWWSDDRDNSDNNLEFPVHKLRFVFRCAAKLHRKWPTVKVEILLLKLDKCCPGHVDIVDDLNVADFVYSQYFIFGLNMVPISRIAMNEVVRKVNYLLIEVINHDFGFN